MEPLNHGCSHKATSVLSLTECLLGSFLNILKRASKEMQPLTDCFFFTITLSSCLDRPILKSVGVVWILLDLLAVLKGD